LAFVARTALPGEASTCVESQLINIENDHTKGHLMIERIAIQNFRCFSELEVSGLRRMNVVVGGNSSGKSAFLESLLMCAGAAAPNVAFQLRAFRQMGTQIQVQADTAAYESLWQDLFHWLDRNKTISIVATGDSGDSRVLRVFYVATTTQTLPFGQQPIGSGLLPQIVFEWQRAGNPPIQVKPKLTASGLQIEGASVDHFPIAMFGLHVADPPEDNAKRFSELSKAGRVQPVVDAMKSEYPFVENLSIEYNNGIGMVFASLAGRREKLPVALISDGVNKLLSVLLAIASFPQGMILIDEFESGFYYKRLPSIWESVYAFARFNEVQIFATTHSQECLHAVVPVLQKNAHDFCLLRANRMAEDSASVIVRFEGEQLLSALSKDGEIR
jgi:hypothetical protein